MDLNIDVTNNEHFKQFAIFYEMLATRAYKMKGKSKSLMTINRSGIKTADNNILEYKAERLKMEIDAVLDIYNEKVKKLMRIE